MPLNTTLSSGETETAKEAYYHSPSEALALALRHLTNGNDNIHLQVAMTEPQVQTSNNANDILRRAISAFG